MKRFVLWAATCVVSLGTWRMPALAQNTPLGATLQEIFSASAGEVLDFDGTRALVVDGSRVRLYSDAGNTLIYDGPDASGGGKLYPGGALIGRYLYDGVNTTLIEGALMADVAGHWLAYAKATPRGDGVPNGPDKIVLRDLTLGQEVRSDDAQLRVLSLTVAENGDVAWVDAAAFTSGNWACWHHGATHNCFSPVDFSFGIRTDGVNAALVHRYSSGSEGVLIRGDFSASIVCGSGTAEKCAIPVLAGGWAGFGTTSFIISAVPKDPAPHRRSPQGVDEAITALPAGAPEAIDDRGRMMLIAGGHRYVAVDPATVFDLGTSDGRAVVRGYWYVLRGPSVYRVILPGEPPSTVIDGGVPSEPDAGVDSGAQDAGPFDASDGADADASDAAGADGSAAEADGSAAAGGEDAGRTDGDAGENGTDSAITQGGQDAAASETAAEPDAGRMSANASDAGRTFGDGGESGSAGGSDAGARKHVGSIACAAVLGGHSRAPGGASLMLVAAALLGLVRRRARR